MNGAVPDKLAQRLSAGTKITLRSGTAIASASAKAGESWNGTLARDLMADGKTVANKGAPVSGISVRLTSVEGEGQGRRGPGCLHPSAGKDQTTSSAIKGGGEGRAVFRVRAVNS